MGQEDSNLDNNTVGTKRINMAFPDKTYNFIIEQAYKYCINYSHLIRYIVRTVNKTELNNYVESQPMRKGSHAFRRRGYRMKRMNVQFSPEIYSFITEGAKEHGTTVTQFVNMIIELYAQSHTNP